MHAADAFGENLAERHAKLLAASGISPEIARQRGYQTATSPPQLRDLGFSKTQSDLVPALLVPSHTPTHEVSYQLRPDTPRLDKAGKPRRYESRWACPLVLDVHPSMRQFLVDPDAQLWVTEGIRKVDALTTQGFCTVGLSGVDCWRGRPDNNSRRTEPLPDWDEIDLR